jgi:hypothetical protein
VLTRYCAPPPSTRGSFGCLVAVGEGRSGQCTALGHPQRRVRVAGHCRVLTVVLTRVRCAPPSGRGPTARSAAHVCRTTACTLKVGERHRTEGDLACAARRVLDGYSRAECRAHRRSAPVRQHCGCLVAVTHSHCARVRVRSADARSDSRADQRRRHQPADVGTDLRADARAELCRPDG